MAKLVSHPALNRKNAGSIPAASVYGACGLTVKTPVCGTGNEGSTPSLCPWLLLQWLLEIASYATKPNLNRSSIIILRKRIRLIPSCLPKDLLLDGKAEFESD